MMICGNKLVKPGKCWRNTNNLNPSSFKPGLAVTQRVGLTRLAENIRITVKKLRYREEGSKHKSVRWEPLLVRPGLAVIKRSRLTNLAEYKRGNIKLRLI